MDRRRRNWRLEMRLLRDPEIHSAARPQAAEAQDLEREMNL
jgi:hypothetical protein